MFIKFYEILDIKFHSLSLNNIKLNFYSLCVFTNNSINQITDNEFEITIYFINFTIRGNKFSENMIFDIRERYIASEYLDKYLFENNENFINKIKSRIIYFKENDIFSSIYYKNK